MLTEAQNKTLTETDPGTPCGDMMRRYWQPVYLSDELAIDQPVGIRVMGENLVLYRGLDGAPALLERYCPHRGVDLSYARVEPEGLRCLYHGWLFAANGQCLEQPNEPASSTFKDRIKHRGYPCADAGGFILAYMGPGEAPPLPLLPFLQCPRENVWVTKRLHECNFIQANDIDPSHLSFLHHYFDHSLASSSSTSYTSQDGAPQTLCEDTRFGLRAYSVRSVANDETYIRLTNFIMPSIQAFVARPVVDPMVERPSDDHGYWLHWHVPIDDTHHWKYIVAYRANGPVDGTYLAAGMTGEVDEHYRPRRTAENHYLQDRAEMRTRTFAGLGNSFQDHDRWASESIGPIYDRTKEHLGVSDRPMIEQRKLIFEAIQDVQEGREPLCLRADVANPYAELITVSGTVKRGEPVEGFWRRATVIAS
jgi:phthalate 4,5-dioxygenase oxygenase subunit